VGAPGHGHFTHRTDGLTQGGFHCVLAKYFASGFGRFSCALRSNRNSILMLALGMCASMAIFAFVDAALIKPLPYPDPGRLVAVFETTIMCPRCNVSYLNFRDWKFGVQPWDLPTLAAVAFVLGSSAIMASYIPARRAASVNPVGALRAE